MAKRRKGRKAKVPPALHELEAKVMDEVWGRDEVTVREVLEALNRGPKQRAYTTIMTIMARLDEKGLLRRRREGKTDVYRAAMSRGGYEEARTRAQVERLVAEHGELALAHFARRLDELDPEQRRRLRKLAEGG